MIDTLITLNVWQEITSACKKTNRRSYVAVAYFGSGAAARLPLKKGSVLVVDADEHTVAQGLTNPKELIKLYRKGVNIYSKAALHAKVYAIGTKVFIGSANVSAHSAKDLYEAVYCTANRSIVNEVRGYVDEMADVKMQIEQLKNLIPIYKTKKQPYEGIIKKANKNTPSFYIYSLDNTEYLPESQPAYEEGRQVARRHWQDIRNSILDDYENTGNTVVKKGDVIVQVVSEGKKTYVYPPATVLYTKTWKKGRTFIYLELPRKRRKNIISVVPYVEDGIFNRDGKKRAAARRQFDRLWK